MPLGFFSALPLPPLLLDFLAVVMDEPFADFVSTVTSTDMQPPIFSTRPVKISGDYVELDTTLYTVDASR